MNLLKRLVPIDELLATAVRFSLSIACALGLFLIAILTIHDIVDFDNDAIARTCVILIMCYFWFGSVRLMTESMELGRSVHLLPAFAGAGFFIMLTLLDGDRWFLPFLYLGPALLLLIMFAPYLRGGDDLSVWFFNHHVWLAVFLSYTAMFLFAGGVSGAIWAVEELFGMPVPHEIYGDIWAFACLVLGPVYVLSGVPRKFFFSKDEVTPPPGLKFMANWITAPMVFVYLAILYAYFIRIMISGEVPNGYLAYLITGFAGAGIITYLLAYPLKEAGTPQLRLFYRVFFPALLIPVGFHFYAIWERVTAYGITEQRYTLDPISHMVCGAGGGLYSARIANPSCTDGFSSGVVYGVARAMGGRHGLRGKPVCATGRVAGEKPFAGGWRGGLHKRGFAVSGSAEYQLDSGVYVSHQAGCDDQAMVREKPRPIFQLSCTRTDQATWVRLCERV